MNTSVIIPTYNRSSLLPMVLDAWREVDKTTPFEYELIFSDDGSTDETLSLLENEKKLPIVIVQNQNGGAAKARNSAIAKSRGKRILFTGDDIFPAPQLLNAHWENAQQHPKEIAILGKVKWHPALNLNHLMYYITDIGGEQFEFHNLLIHGFVDYLHFYTSNISLARDFLFSEPFFFSEKFTKVNFEDTELGYRLSQKGMNIFYLPEAVGYHHHQYETKQFCLRQERAGEMTTVFHKIHPEIDLLVTQIAPIKNEYNDFWKNEYRKISNLGSPDKMVDDILNRCNLYEQLLVGPQTTPCNHELVKENLSNIYNKLFRMFYEKGILKIYYHKEEEKVEHYLIEKFFGWDLLRELIHLDLNHLTHLSPSKKNDFLKRLSHYRFQTKVQCLNNLVKQELDLSHKSEELITKEQELNNIHNELLSEKLEIKRLQSDLFQKEIALTQITSLIKALYKVTFNRIKQMIKLMFPEFSIKRGRK